MNRRTLLGCTLAGLTWRPARAKVRGADLEGLWSLASYTDIERPRELRNLVLTAAEAEAYEAPRRALGGMAPSKEGELGQPESEFNDRGSGLARVKGQIRSSWIIDPADGRAPYRPEALKRLPKPPAERGYEGPEVLTEADRCLVSPAAGPPMLGSADGNLMQIVPTADAVVIVTEKYHDARIVRLEDVSAAERRPPSLAGWSTGRFDGQTLVIESGGFRPGLTLRFQRIFVSGETRVTERLTRIAPRQLLYEFTVRDEALYLQPWRGEITLQAAEGLMFEYACHEGNYAVANILAGVRRTEQDAAAARASTP